MKSAGAILGIVVTIGTAPLARAQQPPGQRGGDSIAERFKQLDRNGDGKISREEGSSLTFFDAADKHKDGFLTLEEAQAYFAARRTAWPAAPEQPSASENEWVRKVDIRYANTPGVDAKWQSLDLYAPKDAKNAPVIIFIHGGGWRRGDKTGEGAQSHARFYTAHGWIYVSVNYRLSPAVTHPLHVEDAARALAFARKHAAEWGGDAAQLYVSGHSAGAHLASLVALNERFLKSAGESLAILLGVVLLDTAAYDLEAIMQGTPDAVSPYPAAFGKDPAVWRDASPLAHIAAGKGVPPFLFVLASGGEDKAERCDAMAAKLRGIGVRAEILDASALRHHGTLNNQFGAADDPVAAKALAFLDSVRRGQANTLGTRETLTVAADVAAKAAVESDTARAGLLIRRSDKNSDRKWSRDEAPALFLRRFDELDTNKDGFLDAREVGAALRANTRNKSDAPAKTTVGALPFPPLAFTKDYFPGTKDAAGPALVGTEMMNFASHGGRLYAGLGNRNLSDHAQVREGAQIIVKDAAEAPWQVEHQFPHTSPRVNALLSATFTTDAAGHELHPPVSMLIAAPSDEDSHETGKVAWATAWTRDDASGAWTKTRVYSATARKPACRSLTVYRDAVTGVCHLFAGASHGAIYRAVCDPAAPGRLRWEKQPELDGTGRVMAFAECEGALYAACGLRKTGEGVNGGLYRRSDGPRPGWARVYQWPMPDRRGGSDEALLMRGLTAVPASDGRGDMLLGTRAWPGVIERIDPRDNHRVTVELNLKDYFAKAWHLPSYTGPSLSAYNRITPWTVPGAGERVHLIGVAVAHPTEGHTPPHNGSWYLVRNADGRYCHGYINDSAHPLPAGQNLRGTRAIEVSPFAADTGRVLYFGGADIGKQISLDTAWIYNATLKE
jgi:arylformamidase